MKALFVNPASAAYGSERSMLSLLQERQFEAEVVCPGGAALERELQRLGIKVLPLEFGRYSVRENPLWHLGFYRSFRQILKARSPDAVVINLDGNTPLVTLAASLARIPVIRFCRLEFEAPTRWLDRWCWLRARAVICPSELVKKQILAWAPSNIHRRVHRLYEAYTGREASAAEASAFRHQWSLGQVRLMGCVGRLHRGKRIEVAIQALAEVRKQLGDIRLLIIGDHDGSVPGMEYVTELKQLARDLYVADAVIFTGYISADQMPAALAACSVCVLPSQSESFGMVLTEAWAQGVPTVASDVGGCREITLASGGGLLARVGDVNVFAQHLLELLTNQHAAAVIGQSGKVWVEQHGTPTEYADQFTALLRSSLSASS